MIEYINYQSFPGCIFGTNALLRDENQDWLLVSTNSVLQEPTPLRQHIIATRLEQRRRSRRQEEQERQQG